MLSSHRLEDKERWSSTQDHHPDWEVRKDQGSVSVHTSPGNWFKWQECLNERVRMDRRQGIATVVGILALAICISFASYLIYANGQAAWDAQTEANEALAANCQAVIDSGQNQVIIDNTC